MLQRRERHSCISSTVTLPGAVAEAGRLWLMVASQIWDAEVVALRHIRRSAASRALICQTAKHLLLAAFRTSFDLWR